MPRGGAECVLLPLGLEAQAVLHKTMPCWRVDTVAVSLTTMAKRERFLILLPLGEICQSVVFVCLLSFFLHSSNPWQFPPMALSFIFLRLTLTLASSVYPEKKT